MPYILSPKIVENTEIMWMEGAVYEKQSIHKIQEGKLPPVNYDLHKIKPHSLTHAEGSLHVLENGKSIDQYFSNPSYFYGSCLVIKLLGNNYKLINSEKRIFHWEITLQELIDNLERVVGHKIENGPDKILISTEIYHTNLQGYHDPNYVLTLSKEAAEFLVKNNNFNLFGTSWKSTDYNPGGVDRPIHKTIFTKAIIFELLDLEKVPEGEYFFVGFPLRLQNASESPVTPVLFCTEELK